MCGRMAITLPHQAMAEVFDAVPTNDLPADEPNYNVCPTQTIAVATSIDGVRHLRPMRWGFLPHWYKSPTDGPLLINARSETIAEKPAFRAACRERRCLIAVDGFYEWKREEGRTPSPWFVQRSDGEPMVFAGVWQNWERDGVSLTTCAVVTCDANEQMAPIHHRLPVIVEQDQFALWLGEEGHGAARLMKPAQPGIIDLYRVSTKVNSNRASGPELLEPLVEDDPD